MPEPLSVPVTPLGWAPRDPDAPVHAGRLVVVLYDIADDDRRAAIRAALRPIADRSQQSTWVVEPRPGLTPDRLAAGLASFVRPAMDCLWVHQPCTACLRALAWAPARPDPLGWLGPQVL